MLNLPRHSLASTLMRPFLSTFAEVGHRRVLHYKASSVKLDAPVISVGNITFGGTSKTPVAEFIARQLIDDGFKPGIVFRGYRGRVDRENLPPKIVFDGKIISLDWHESGDEAFQIASTFKNDQLDIPIAVGRDRVMASELLIDEFNVDFILLDDGYQYSRLDRDLDIVLVDALAPFGSTSIANGILREPVNSLDRAEVVVITHTEAVDSNRLAEINQKIQDATQGITSVLFAATKVKSIRNFHTEKSHQPSDFFNSKYLAFAGVGNFDSFRYTVNSLPGNCVGLTRFPDHHPYTIADIRKISRKVKQLSADTVLTTAKDAVRLRQYSDIIDFALEIVEIDVEFDDSDTFFRAVRDAVTINN